MSYNARLFNLYGWENDQNTDLRMYDFIEQTDPDILALQEFYDDPKIVIEYPFHYKKMQGSANKVGQIIYSKFPIIKAGSMDFQDTANNAIYADLKINKDTVRIYNIHLESLRISPNKTKVDNRARAAIDGYEADHGPVDILINNQRAMEWSGCAKIYVPKIGVSDGLIRDLYHTEFKSQIEGIAQ